MNSLDLRNQKLAEFRAQRAKGIKRSVIISQHPDYESSSINSHQPPLSEPESINSEVKGLLFTEDLQENLLKTAENPGLSEIPLQSTQTENNPKNSEISDLLALISSKKQKISTLLHTAKSLFKEKQSIYLETKTILDQQSTIRKNYNEKVIFK